MAKEAYFSKFSKVDKPIQLKFANLHCFIAYNLYGGVGHRGHRSTSSKKCNDFMSSTGIQLRSVLLLEGERDSTV